MHSIYSHKPPTIDPTYGVKAGAVRRSYPLPADWIWTPSLKDTQTVVLRGSFDLKEVPREAVSFTTADNYFKLFINGKECDSSQPIAGNDLVWQILHKKNITHLLHKGRNNVVIVAINAGGSAGVLFGIRAGNATLFTSGKNWQGADITGLPEAGEDTPPQLPVSSYSKVNVEGKYGISPWGTAVSGWPGGSAPYLRYKILPPTSFLHVDAAGGKLRRVSADSLVLQMPSGGKNPSVVVDFGQEIAGRVKVTSPDAVSMGIGTGESEGEAVHGPWGGVHKVSADRGMPAVTPWSAFRYAKIEFTGAPAGKTVPITIQVDHKYYPVQYKGAFECSDPLLNKIWYTGAYTAHLCMQEYIWDAPKRDRARWMGDLQVSGRVIDDVFADKFLMEQTMQRLRDDAQGNRPPTKLPAGYVNGIPGYSAAWIVGLSDFEKRVGDRAYILKQHDLLGSMLRYMAQDINSKGLFTNSHNAWDYVDWSPGFNSDGALTRSATQMYYIRAFKDAAFLYSVMGDKNAQDKALKEAKMLTASAQDYLWQKQLGAFSNRRQDNAMAVFAGVATPAERRSIYQAVFQPNSPAWNQIATPYYDNYVLFAMSDCGKTPESLQFARSFWGGMLAEGATSFWEGYDLSWPKKHFHKYLQADNGMGYFVSLCHGWSSGVTAWLTERVLGVRPTGAAFSTAVIQPELGYLHWAKGDVPTPNGILRVEVQQKEGRLSGYVLLPKGVTALLKANSREKTVTGPGRYRLP